MTVIKRWKAIFVSKLSSSEVGSLDYVIDRTQLRSRELLQFCKQCVECLDYSLVSKRIDERAIAAAEAAYSEQKTRDLAAEYRFQYPALLDAFEVFWPQKTYYSSTTSKKILIICYFQSRLVTLM